MLATINFPKLRFKEFTDEWQEKKLGDIVEFKNGKAHEQDISEDGKYIVINSKFVSTDGRVKKYSNKQTSPVYKNDIVMVMSDIPNGKAIAKCFFVDNDDRYTLNQRICALTAKKNIAYPRYLINVINRNPFYLKFDDGVKQTNLRRDDVTDLPIILPEFQEQSKIASFLTTVDEKIVRLQERKKGFEKYKKGVMQAIFSQIIRFKKPDGSSYPDWEEKKLGEIGKTYSGLTGKSAEDFGEGSPYITYMQIFGGSSIDMSKCRRVKIGEKENQNEVKKGDIFFTTSSETPEEVGFSSALLSSDEVAYLNSFCFGYRLENIAKYLPDYLNIFFRSECFRKKIIRLAQGSTRFNLSKIEMMKIVIKIPSAGEQEIIAEFLTSLDNKVDLISKELEQTKLFKKSLLQQMFV